MKKLSQMVIGLSMVPLSNQWRHSSLTWTVTAPNEARPTVRVLMFTL